MCWHKQPRSGRSVTAPGAGFLILLASVGLESDWAFAIGKTELQRFFQLTKLAVGQRIHGINDDRLNAAPRARPQDVVHDGHDVGEALARAGPSRLDVVPALFCLPYGIFLMLVKAMVLSAADRGGFIAPEDLAAASIENTGPYKLVNGLARLEGWVQLNHRIGPQGAGRKTAFNELIQPGLSDRDETRNVIAVVLDDLIAEAEYVHVGASWLISGPGFP